MAGRIDIVRDGAIATVVLEAPERLNALDMGMWRQLESAFATLDGEDDLRCVVVRGAGDKAFAAGADIAEFTSERSNVEQARVYGGAMHGAQAAALACRHPVVAMIRGACVGGGLELAATCDLRICGQSSRFGVPVNRLGLVVAYEEMAPLVQLVGKARALEIVLEGRVFGADEALAMGLVNRVVPDGEVEAEAYATAGRIAAGAPLVAHWHKRFVNRLMDPSPLTPAERDEGYDCFATEDFRIGVRSFLDKSKPRFEGR